MIDYGKFILSLKRLEEQYENYRTLDASLPFLTQEAIAESVMRRFKACYDCLWKVLKRYLIEGLGIADVPNSPKGLSSDWPLRTTCSLRHWRIGWVTSRPA